MIRINLLPHREEARKYRKKQFYIQLGLSVLLGALVCAAVFGWYQSQISRQRDRNNFLMSEITRLDEEIKDIATLQAQIASLRARQTAVEDLQANRNLPVHLLNELVAHLPDGVFLTSVKQESESILLTGVSQSQERVSELLRNLSNRSVWLSKPQLVEIVASTLKPGSRDQKRVSNFTMRAILSRPTVESNTANDENAGAVLNKV